LGETSGLSLTKLGVLAFHEGVDGPTDCSEGIAELATSTERPSRRSMARAASSPNRRWTAAQNQIVGPALPRGAVLHAAGSEVV
jgi:hypothetical protein